MKVYLYNKPSVSDKLIFVICTLVALAIACFAYSKRPSIISGCARLFSEKSAIATYQLKPECIEQFDQVINTYNSIHHFLKWASIALTAVLIIVLIYRIIIWTFKKD